MKTFVRHAGMVGASPFVSSIFDKKYEAPSIAIDPSVFVGSSRPNAWRTSGVSLVENVVVRARRLRVGPTARSWCRGSKDRRAGDAR
jgi:hypothetical protein